MGSKFNLPTLINLRYDPLRFFIDPFKFTLDLSGNVPGHRFG